MPQLMWQNTNNFDEWRGVSSILKTSLAPSGVQITKSVDVTKTVGSFVWESLWRRVAKIEDGFYAEFYDIQGALLNNGAAIGLIDRRTPGDSDRLSLTKDKSISGGVGEEPLEVGVATSAGCIHRFGDVKDGAVVEYPEYALAKEDSLRILRGEDPRFGAPELYVAAAFGTSAARHDAYVDVGRWSFLPTPGASSHKNFVSGRADSEIQYTNSYFPIVVANPEGTMFQVSFTNSALLNPATRPHEVNEIAHVFPTGDGGVARSYFISTTYLRIAPSVDGNGELVNPTQFVALPLVSSLIVGDGILAALCVPVDGVAGSGCFVVAGKMAPTNSNAEAYPLAILRKAPVIWGTPSTRTRYMTAHTVGSLGGSQDAYTMDFWRGSPPVATDSKMGGIVAATPYIYGSGVTPEFRGSFDAVEFCADSVSRGASAWKGSKRYLCVDKGLLLRTI